MKRIEIAKTEFSQMQRASRINTSVKAVSLN
ncbi:hypothetical protein T11_10698 [Trichinella zimbabwensis]|uniref:Uncharacterized protein n=1 Tax=Trichinella zimbabwensis TaxID=268475 RepID=A0A0V1GJV1_9BILA|nr:hypothetical protein T11_10698 [Trichinella zimbabwensis]